MATVVAKSQAGGFSAPGNIPPSPRADLISPRGLGPAVNSPRIDEAISVAREAGKEVGLKAYTKGRRSSGSGSGSGSLGAASEAVRELMEKSSRSLENLASEVQKLDLRQALTDIKFR